MFSVEVDAILFDCDGVLVDSIDAAALAWNRWASVWLPGFDFHRDVEHGRRLADFVAENIAAAHVDAATADLVGLERELASQVQPIRGAPELLTGLPVGSWAVVTSGRRDIALARLSAAGLPVPAFVVTAEDVAAGKPAPDPYLLGARLMGVAPRRCAVFEDAPAGVTAASAAGVEVVVGVGGSVDRGSVAVSVTDLRAVTFDGTTLRVDTDNRPE